MQFSTIARLSLVSAAIAASFAAAAEPAIVYDMGGKFDKSFNEAAYVGMENWKKETGKQYLEFEIANESQREQAIRRMAEKGASPIIGVGFSQASAIEKVAKEFPKLNFVIVDMVVGLPNVQSVVFKEQEGSFLVGAMAAMAPTRKLPSCSLNTTDCTLGRPTTMSTITKLSLGNSLATFSMAEACEKPTPMMGLAPFSAIRRIACSRCDSLAISNSRYCLPVSFFQASMPTKAASLKDLSNLPPMS